MKGLGVTIKILGTGSQNFVVFKEIPSTGGQGGTLAGQAYLDMGVSLMNKDLPKGLRGGRKEPDAD